MFIQVEFLNEPMMQQQLRSLRGFDKQFKQDGEIGGLLSGIQELCREAGTPGGSSFDGVSRVTISREDLQLVCFDVISGG